MWLIFFSALRWKSIRNIYNFGDTRRKLGTLCFFLIFPIMSDGCCEMTGDVGQKKTVTPTLQDLNHSIRYHRYRAVEGESFVMPCIISTSMGRVKVTWSRTGGNEGPSIVCGQIFPAEAKHSGNYTCLTGSSSLFLYLQVEKASLGCFQPKKSAEELQISVGGNISCPGHNCTDTTDIQWYKANISVPEKPRSPSCIKNGELHFCQVKGKSDAGVYFCDQQITDNEGFKWIFRRNVKVKVVFYSKGPPRINGPRANTTEDVELGQPYNLTCKVYFPTEKKISARVQWFMSSSGSEENMALLDMGEPQLLEETENCEEYGINQAAIIKTVTAQHLTYKYTCVATNAFGTVRVTIRLKETIKAGSHWWSLVGAPVACLLLVTVLGVVLHLKWLEIQLVYRSRFQHGKHDGDEKKFDVFLSYVLSPESAEVVTFLSQSGHYTDEEAAYLSSMEPLSTGESSAAQRRLEVLLPRVLEDQWGYRLLLPERDILPGGAYTHDVVLALQRSRMLICLLSDDYFCNSNAVFVLEAGVQALQQKSALKLLLIWTTNDRTSLIQQDPPLSTLVQRSVKVLPSLNWTSDKPATKFWTSLRKAMPEHSVMLTSLTHDQ